ncbi:hypothetical protein D3C71_1391050 [compost metagenome]
MKMHIRHRFIIERTLQPRRHCRAITYLGRDDLMRGVVSAQRYQTVQHRRRNFIHRQISRHRIAPHEDRATGPVRRIRRLMLIRQQQQFFTNGRIQQTHAARKRLGVVRPHALDLACGKRRVIQLKQRREVVGVQAVQEEGCHCVLLVWNTQLGQAHDASLAVIGHQTR